MIRDYTLVCAVQVGGDVVHLGLGKNGPGKNGPGKNGPGKNGPGNYWISSRIGKNGPFI